jgi:DNA-binding MarR family transcriptional regulator
LNLHRSLVKIYREFLLHELMLINSDFGSTEITYNSLLYLDIILVTENCTISQIANSLNIAKSSVTLKVQELERMGLVYKVQSKTDKRQFYLKLTEKSKELGQVYNIGISKSIKEISKKYSKQDIRNFIEMLEIIRINYIDECDNRSKEI